MKSKKTTRRKSGATKADTGLRAMSLEEAIDYHSTPSRTKAQQAEIDRLNEQFSETLQSRKNSIDDIKLIKDDLSNCEANIRDYEAMLHRSRIHALELTTLLRETVTAAQREAELIAHS